MSFIPGPLRLRRENQRFFINTNEVRGAQSLQFSYAVPSVPLRHIGQTGVHHVPHHAGHHHRHQEVAGLPVYTIRVKGKCRKQSLFYYYYASISLNFTIRSCKFKYILVMISA